MAEKTAISFEDANVIKQYVDESIPTVSNPNIFDNRYFADPINQRGKTEYTGTAQMIDRWAAFDKKQVSLKLEGNSYLSLSFINSETTIWGQIIDNPDLYFGKTMTFSVLTAESDLKSSTITLKSKGTAIESTHVTVKDSCWMNIFYADSNVLFARFVSTKPTTVDIMAVKLELGDKQTLVHQDDNGRWVLNDPPPCKALELTKCQRYYQVFASETSRPTKAEDFRPPMRANPALSTIIINNATYYTADANI